MYTVHGSVMTGFTKPSTLSLVLRSVCEVAQEGSIVPAQWDRIGRLGHTEMSTK